MGLSRRPLAAGCAKIAVGTIVRHRAGPECERVCVATSAAWVRSSIGLASGVRDTNLPAGEIALPRRQQRAPIEEDCREDPPGLERCHGKSFAKASKSGREVLDSRRARYCGDDAGARTIADQSCVPSSQESFNDIFR